MDAGQRCHPITALRAYLSGVPFYRGPTSVHRTAPYRLPPSAGFARRRFRYRPAADCRARQNRADPVRAGLCCPPSGRARRRSRLQRRPEPFRRATKKPARLAEAWYGMGAAYTARSEWEMHDRLRLGSRVGLGTLERAADQYVRSLRADLRYVPAAVALARVELSLLDTARLRRLPTCWAGLVRSWLLRQPDLLLAWGGWLVPPAAPRSRRRRSSAICDRRQPGARLARAGTCPSGAGSAGR